MKFLITAFLFTIAMFISPNTISPIEKKAQHEKVAVTQTIKKSPYQNMFLITYSRIEKENISCIVDEFESHVNIYWHVAVVVSNKEVKPLVTALIIEEIAFYPEGDITTSTTVLSDTDVDGRIEEAKHIYKIRNSKEEDIHSKESKLEITADLQEKWEGYLMYMHGRWEEDKKILKGKKL